MNPVEYNILHLLHVAALLVLTGYLFYAFAAPAESRKGVMIVTGIATLIALLTGIRMWQAMFSFSMMGWVIVKAICWLGVSALTGMAYRKRAQAKALMGLAVVLLVVAVAMVYLKPF
jgi:hypothetical protein